MTSGPERQLASLLPEYTVERELGRGAMGVVYLARHERLGRLVAVKELQGALAADSATRERFHVEAKVLATLNHPHVVPVFDYIERDDRCVLVMEQLPGGTVWDRFVATGLTMPQATAITLATCSAMQHAHESGVLHRDIKPENLMFDAEGVLKVTDFGVARMVNGASTKATVAGSVLGTPAYMAPEQAEGKTVGPPADVYATATMFYEMVSGRLPFDRADSLASMLAQRITTDPRPLITVAPHVPEPVAVAAMHGLARSTTTRSASAVEFGTGLAEAAVEAWGPGWLDASGLVVRGSERIDRAARTLRVGEVRQATDTAPGGARRTVVTGTATESPVEAGDRSTVIGPDDTPAGPDTATGPGGPEGPGSATEPETGGHDGRGTPAAPPADLTPVKPQPSDRDVGRARADEIDQLIDISEVLAAPARPIAQFAIAGVLFVAGLAWSLVGGGAPDVTVDSELTGGIDLTVAGVRPAVAGDPIELDLGEPIRVAGVPEGASVTMAFEQLGVPVGSTDTVGPVAGGTAELDAGFLANVTAGALVATVETFDAAGAPTGSVDVEVTGTNPWFLTATGVVSLLLLLFALAGIESNLRAFRRGRNGLATYAGLVVTGGLLGASTSVALMVIAGTARGPVAVIGPAALCAAGAVALGVATRANRARRRAAKQALRHTAIKALASR